MVATVDIIVRAHDGHAMTKRCLESIRNGTPAGTYRLILVDDGSDPALSANFSDVLIRLRENKGAVTASNCGLAHALATGPDDGHILIMDNDTIVPAGDQGWLARMCEVMDRSPRIGAVGATTAVAAGFQHILAAPPTYQADWTNARSGASGVKAEPDVPVFVSFCVLLRKSAVRECGLWDTRYDPGNWEDTDYAVKLRMSGYTIKVANSVYIHHEGHKTFKEGLMTLLRVNAQKFYQKWGVGLLYDLGIVPKEALQ